MKKIAIILSIIMIVAVIAGCGNSADADNIMEDTQFEENVEIQETEEEKTEEETDEQLEESRYTGYNHYIDPEEAAKAAESEEQEEQSSAEDKTNGTKVAASETTVKENENTEQTQASVSETTQSSEAATNTESNTAPKSVLPDCALADGEWYPPVPVFIIKDQAEVHDEPNASSGVQGRLDYGTSIGSVGRSGDYIRVNYGVKPAWIEISAISVEDPLK